MPQAQKVHITTSKTCGLEGGTLIFFLEYKVQMRIPQMSKLLVMR